MKKFLGILVSLCLLMGAGTALGESRELRSLAARPAELTPSENRSLVVLTVGDMLLLRLGESPQWRAEVTGDAEMTRVIDVLIPRGAQGLWEAKAPGTTVIRAIGYLPCHLQQPACKAANPMYEVQVMVQPARHREGTYRIGQDGTFLANSRTYVPAAALAAELGAGYADAGNGSVRLTAGGPAVTLDAGSKEMTVGSEMVAMDVAPVVKDGVLYLPMRWVAEALGYRVAWDGTLRTATYAGK